VQFLVGEEAFFPPTLFPPTKKAGALLNVYGPTETTIWSTGFRIESDFASYAERMKLKDVPIGKATYDTQLYLVGETAIMWLCDVMYTNFSF
jgi:non-ribosomal peptide synthetase component F